MGNCCARILGLHRGLDTYFLPLVTLFARIFVALIFWRSATTALQDMNITAYLFEHEFKITFVDPVIGAYLSTYTELICSALLAFGLLGRISAGILFFMTLLIQFTYMELDVHIYWAIILAWVATKGAGTLSVDYLIKRRCIIKGE